MIKYMIMYIYRVCSNDICFLYLFATISEVRLFIDQTCHAFWRWLKPDSPPSNFTWVVWNMNIYISGWLIVMVNSDG